MGVDRPISMKYNVLHGGDGMAFSIRLTEDERALAESYAKIHSYSLAEAFKKALFEKIEEEYDVAVIMQLTKNTKKVERKAVPLKSSGRSLKYELFCRSYSAI